MSVFSRITACSYNLIHCPAMTFHYGSAPESEREVNPDSEFLKNLDDSFRSFSEAAAYPPNQVFIGNIDPLDLPGRPWKQSAPGASPSGPFGEIVDETVLLGLLKLSDSFDLVLLEQDFSRRAKEALQGLDAFSSFDLSKFDKEVLIDQINAELQSGALPLYSGGKSPHTLCGCVKPAHPDDINLSAHVILENLASKAGAVLSVNNLLEKNSVDPLEIDYIIETSEEACGDSNQRGGGNFAKAIGELAGLKNATGSDTRSFCAGPVHGILQAASLIKAGTFNKVIVTAGGTTAKLAMNAKKHIQKGFPVLEDCMGAFAILVEGGDPREAGDIIIRNDIVGIHRIGSGSSPQHVIQNLVADPLEKAGIRFDGVGYYAPELHNPEVTEAGGAGNVTQANLKMIAALAVMKKQLERTEIDSFIQNHGSSGWAPTQGHIPSGIPALGWISRWFASGRIKNAMVIGKGSLFLGRMTGLFDGVSILLEASSVKARADAAPPAADEPAAKADSSKPGSTKPSAYKPRVGLTIPGSESGAHELYRGAAEAEALLPGLEVVTFGEPDSDPDEAHRQMEAALASGDVASAVTFHYNFPVGTATIGLARAPGTGRDLFIAATTGMSDTDRVTSLIKNAVAGAAAAKAWGIPRPEVGVLNLDGARAALQALKALKKGGYDISLTGSVRGEELLRGNDILGGAADVIVCDSLSGNAFIKLLAGFTSGGRTEVSGSGYGPGIGGSLPLVNIISRASSAAVVSGALLYSARMAASGLNKIHAEELASAKAAGFAPGPVSAGRIQPGGTEPESKTVDTEIEGVDVLRLDEAVALLKSKNIYCEAAMGCTGPVVMTASEDTPAAQKYLADHNFIGEA